MASSVAQSSGNSGFQVESRWRSRSRYSCRRGWRTGRYQVLLGLYTFDAAGSLETLRPSPAGDDALAEQGLQVVGYVEVGP